MCLFLSPAVSLKPQAGTERVVDVLLMLMLMLRACVRSSRGASPRVCLPPLLQLWRGLWNPMFAYFQPPSMPVGIGLLFVEKGPVGVIRSGGDKTRMGGRETLASEPEKAQHSNGKRVSKFHLRLEGEPRPLPARVCGSQAGCFGDGRLIGGEERPSSSCSWSCGQSLLPGRSRWRTAALKPQEGCRVGPRGQHARPLCLGFVPGSPAFVPESLVCALRSGRATGLGSARPVPAAPPAGSETGGQFLSRFG